MTAPRKPVSEAGQRSGSAANPPVTGLLNINKPPDMTSHDVVAIVRRIAHQRRVGHAGTLDPMATGVLVVALGAATRVVEYVAEGSKSYRATLRFGVITDTWDAEGEVIEERDASGLTLAAIEAALPAFTGEIQQVPPMYSALKRGGQPLYKLARQGITVEREPRPVTIYRLVIENWSPPELTLRVDCSTGTYVRSLAYDLGQALGTGAHLSALTRLAVGQFRLEDAVELDELQSQAAQGEWQRHLLPMHLALSHLPGIMVDEDTARRISFGQAVALDVQGDSDIGYAYREGFLALLRRDPSNKWWHPSKVLLSL